MTLPPELVEQIIDNLAQQDHNELLTYSVVARAWRPRALSYLFRTIKVYSFGTPLRHATDWLAFEPNAFIRMQESAPHLLWYVRHLIIRMVGDFAKQENFMHFARTVCFPAPCALATLEFLDYPGMEGGLGLFDNFAVRFPTLRRIELSGLCTLPMDEISKATSVAQELLLVIPSAYREAMPAISAVPTDTEVKVAVQNLRSLHLVNSDYRMNTKFYAQVARLCACAPNLRRVTVTNLSKSALFRFVPASSAFKNCIQELHFDVVPHNVLTQDHLDAALLHCPNLRVLRLEAQMPDLQLSFPSASRMLERLHYTIHNVDMKAWTPRMFRSSCGWPALDYCTSSRDIMPAMRQVSLTFVITSSDTCAWNATLGALAKQLLPQLHSSGMLEWSVVQGHGARFLG